MGCMEHKLSAYANDILFHVTDPLVLLLNLLVELNDYGQVSNFKINYTKSKIKPITALGGMFSFIWTPKQGVKTGLLLRENSK